MPRGESGGPVRPQAFGLGGKRNQAHCRPGFEFPLRLASPERVVLQDVRRAAHQPGVRGAGVPESGPQCPSKFEGP